jgi:hypothetical protein
MNQFFQIGARLLTAPLKRPKTAAAAMMAPAMAANRITMTWLT